MANASFIDSLIGLILTYLSLSIACSGLNEMITSFVMIRPTFLLTAIRRLVGHRIASEIYRHPIIEGLKTPREGIMSYFDQDRNPSYIPSRTFVIAFLDAIRPEPQRKAHVPPMKLDEIRSHIVAALKTDSSTATPDSADEAVSRMGKKINIVQIPITRSFPITLSFKSTRAEQLGLQQVLSVIDDLGPQATDLAAAKTALETWFNAAMDRATGWYKRRTQWRLFAIALVISVSLDADTFTIVDQLWKNTNSAMRASLITSALQVTKVPLQVDLSYKDREKTIAGIDAKVISQISNGLSDNQKPLGGITQSGPAFLAHPLKKISGWLITALAVSLGAPFWFDLLNKFINLRSTGTPIKDGTPAGAGKTV